MRSRIRAANRRGFLKAAAATAVACPYIVTSAAMGTADRAPACERIVVGGIGIGGRGGSDMKTFLGRDDVQYVAVCDVRESARKRAKGRVDSWYGNKDCMAYNDFREMTGRSDIDAVHIATPDHWHAAIVIEACLNDKDVFCQKPETLTLREGWLMVNAARRYGLVVSGGSQRVLEDHRRVVNNCWSGAKGAVKSINVRALPLSQPCNLPAEEIPPGVDWDMWLGPAPWAPFNRGRLKFRPWRDYSGGVMTDIGAHLFGAATFAVDIRGLQPVEVIYNNEEDCEFLTYRYQNGVLLHHGHPGQKLLEVVYSGDSKPAKEVPVYKGNGGILGDFLHCVKTRERPFRDIELAINTMAVCHLGTIAYRLKRSLKWDPANRQFPGDDEANRLVDRARREPWRL